ncbi:hypothetical protein KY345_02190 [Candidatus Woesearchaeota archaeon]|nr:hypothetical protein [Candidatus Woesearchaeota archaeon]
MEVIKMFAKKPNKWKEDSGSYNINLFRNDRKIDPHKLIINHKAEEPYNALEQYSERDIKVDCAPGCQGPLENTLFDTSFIVQKDDFVEGFNSVFHLYFLNQKLVYGAQHPGEVLDSPYVLKEFNENNLEQGLIEYFGKKAYNKVIESITNSDLPEEYKAAVKPVIG